VHNDRKTTKSDSPVGIALVGAFATIAGIGEIVVGLTGNYLGILAHPAGAPLILALCRSKPHGLRLRYLLVLGSDGAEDDGAALRRFGPDQRGNCPPPAATISHDLFWQTQMKRRFVSKNLDYRQGEHAAAHSA